MKRRDLFKNSLALSTLGVLGAQARGARRVHASPGPAAEFPKAPGLTKSVAEDTAWMSYYSRRTNSHHRVLHRDPRWGLTLLLSPVSFPFSLHLLTLPINFGLQRKV